MLAVNAKGRRDHGIELRELQRGPGAAGDADAGAGPGAIHAAMDSMPNAELADLIVVALSKYGARMARAIDGGTSAELRRMHAAMAEVDRVCGGEGFEGDGLPPWAMEGDRTPTPGPVQNPWVEPGPEGAIGNMVPAQAVPFPAAAAAPLMHMPGTAPGPSRRAAVPEDVQMMNSQGQGWSDHLACTESQFQDSQQQAR